MQLTSNGVRGVVCEIDIAGKRLTNGRLEELAIVEEPVAVWPASVVRPHLIRRPGSAV